MAIVKLNIDGVDYSCQPIPSITIPPPGVLILVPEGITPTTVKLDALTNWTGVHDAGTPGTAVGTTFYPVTIGGRQARSFPNTFTGNGGLRYHNEYAKNTSEKSFVFGGDLWIDNPGALGQMELDNNQVDAAGKTYIFGVQCDANTGTWMITRQDASGCHWVSTSFKGNPKTWPAKTWLHFEHLCHRDDAGKITYDSIHFNGVTQKIGVTLPSASALGWEKLVALVNVQIGGSGSGEVTVYASNLQVARF